MKILKHIETGFHKMKMKIDVTSYVTTTVKLDTSRVK